MKVLVVCLLVTASLTHAAPSDVLSGDQPAPPPFGMTSGSSLSSSSSSLSTTSVEKTSVDSAAAELHEDKKESVVGVVPPSSVSPVDADKPKSEGSDKKDVVIEPVVEAAEPSKPSTGQDLPAAAPVKKVPVFVPVEYAGAYHPDNFFNPYPVSSGLGGYVTAPSAAYPYRSVGHPWYQLVSPEVPVVTLYPDSSDDLYRATACDDPTLRYIHGGPGMIYTGPAAASPYAANHFAAASLANMAPGGNPNPYGAHAPYKLFYTPEASYIPSIDYSRSTLISPTMGSSISPLARLTPFVYHPSSLADMSYYTTPIWREYAAEPDRRIQLHV